MKRSVKKSLISYPCKNNLIPPPPAFQLGTLEWNGTEKFYGYTDWLRYIIANFAIPNGCEVNGRIAFQGEADADCGVLVVSRNVVTSETIDHNHFDDARDFCLSLKEQGMQAHIKV